MASILDLYKGQSKILGTDKIGPGNDETPYSIGIDEKGTKAFDEKAVATLENKLGVTRYAVGNLPKAAGSDKDNYSQITDVNK
jgi:hypothetical protein